MFERNFMNKKDSLWTVLEAAEKRADTLRELAAESEGYGDTDAARQFEEEADEISLACAELNDT
jgi:hypothetical protein